MLNNCINERLVLYLRGILCDLAVSVVKTLMSHRSFGISAEKKRWDITPNYIKIKYLYII